MVVLHRPPPKVTNAAVVNSLITSKNGCTPNSAIISALGPAQRAAKIRLVLMKLPSPLPFAVWPRISAAASGPCPCARAFGMNFATMTPIKPAPKTTTGKGTPPNCNAAKAPIARPRAAGPLQVLLPIRYTAAMTMATTTGLMPSKIAATAPWSPYLAAIHASAIIRIMPGRTNIVPANTAPLTPCSRQPM